MKKLLILVVAASATFASCKKKDDVKTCDATVAGITGNYKITKVEAVAGGVTNDVTSTYLFVACEKDDIYQLKADKTVTYQDAGTACSPSSAGTGTWDVVNGKLTIDHDGDGYSFIAAGVKNNCTNIVIEESVGGITLKFILTKQ
jgi:Lipocalin-like domain